jgi:phosphohistidine swiveling domain-containing protein
MTPLWNPWIATTHGSLNVSQCLTRSPYRSKQARVAQVVGDEALLVQQAAVPLVQLERQVPVVQGDEGRDAEPEALVDHVVVELEALLADRVVGAAERDDARPRDGEAVRVDAERGHHWRRVS